jgi:hypothetical protein
MLSIRIRCVGTTRAFQKYWLLELSMGPRLRGDDG